jgi:uncharacterized protein (DUF1778 family)
MAKMGRPPMPKRQRQSSVVALRVTAKERHELQQVAEKTGVSLSDFIRRALGLEKEK